MGSVTLRLMKTVMLDRIFQLTRSVGSVTTLEELYDEKTPISTHTLRGERDHIEAQREYLASKFQLTRSVGSVTSEI